MTTADICDANTFATPPAGGKFQILQFAAKLSDNWHAAGKMKSWNTDEYFKEFPNFKLWPKSLKIEGLWNYLPVQCKLAK